MQKNALTEPVLLVLVPIMRYDTVHTYTLCKLICSKQVIPEAMEE